MTETLAFAVALFVVVTAATLSLTAVLAPDPAARGRATALLLTLFRAGKSR